MLRCRPYKISIALLLFLTFAIPGTSRADLRSEIIEVATRITNLTIIPDFTPLLQDSHPGFFQEYRIAFPKTRGMRTFVDTKRKVISIPSDLLCYTFLIATGAATTQVVPEYSPIFPKYLAYVMLVAQDRNNDPLSSAMPFWMAAKIPHDRAVSIEQSPLYLRAFELYFSHALAFIIAHEACHVISNHPSPDTISNKRLRQQEFESDAYAIRMLHKLGTFASSSISVLYPYLSVDQQSEHIASPDHPVVTCRLYRIFETELPILESNPGYTDAITQHSIDTAQLRREMEELKKHCQGQQ